jgi:hypothetical protein
MDKIHPNIVFTLAGKGRDGQYDVWGERDISDYKSYGYADGKAHGEAKREAVENTQVTDRQSQLDPQFREQPPINRGVPLSEIPADLITIDTEVDV